MIGLRFDFENNDIGFNGTGQFIAATIDSQTCALIAVSQVCRITIPELGAELPRRIINRKTIHVGDVIADAVRMVEADGGTNVSITLAEGEDVNFMATYED